VELLHDERFNPTQAVVFDFAETAAAASNVRDFLLPGQRQAAWQGTLVTDDFSGYKACFELGVTEAGCMAHARRKFHELWANHGSTVGEQALKYFQVLYEDRALKSKADNRRRTTTSSAGKSRRVAACAAPVAAAQRQLVPDGSATARPSTTASSAGQALTRYIDDGDVPISTTGSRTRSGRLPWAGELAVRRQPARGQAGRGVMSLVHSAKLNGHDPYAYLKDVLERLPTQAASKIENCCRIAGSRWRLRAEPVRRSQGDFAGRLQTSTRWIRNNCARHCVPRAPRSRSSRR
jgi:transposase